MPYIVNNLTANLLEIGGVMVKPYATGVVIPNEGVNDVLQLSAQNLITYTGSGVPFVGSDAEIAALRGVASGGGVPSKAKALRGFHAALALRSSAPCNVLHIGDSITWGLLSGTLAARWPDVLRDRLRQRFPQSQVGGVGFISTQPVFGAQTHTDARVVRTGGSVASSNFGPDQHGFVMSATGNKEVFTFTGTGCDILYAIYGGGGTFSYAVDGGATTNIVTNGSTNYAARNQAIRGLSVGSHTVEVAWVSGTSYMTGLVAYNGDESAGIRTWVSALPGSASSYWWNVSANYWLNHITTNIDPHLVTIELGANDYGTVTPIGVATFKANVQNIIAGIKSRVGGRVPSFVLIPVWPLVPSGTPLATWAEYVAAMREIEAADSDGAVYVHDWQQRTTSVAGTTLGGLMPDTAHPGPALNTVLAEMLLTDISPA